jgi:FMN-dependent oxidoreductase (nitrilotriacetate monooxygenase family)
MKLGLFFEPSGRHIAAWRHPDAHPAASVSIENLVGIAKAAEAALFDFLFIADNNAVWEDIAYLQRIERSAVLDPMIVLPVLATATQRIGLIATVSTTYTQPYHLARSFSSLDQVSNGRAGWNLVTSMFEGEARNFSHGAHPAHGDRYARAEEYADVVLGLWDSFDPDAFIRDKASGIYFDQRKMRPLGHKGAHFSVEGPLNVPPSPQGRPILVQAGSSDAGQELAARTADVVFAAQQTFDEAKDFYRGLKSRLPRHGRAEEDVVIMPGMSPVIGESEAHAREKYEQLQELIHPAVGLSLLSTLIGGFDLSAYPLDGPLPELPSTSGGKGRQQVLTDLARRENLSIRQLYKRAIGSRGHWQPIGTPIQIADMMEERFLGGGADGFNVMPPSPPDLADFARLVVPELQRRGLFRRAYEGDTLRQNLGLNPAIPANTRKADAYA